MQDKQMEPVYCVKCQQFFGNPSNLNMCSKCFKDHTKLNQSV